MANTIKNFFLGAFDELKKVVWPTRREVTSHTAIVIISIIVSMAVIAAIDFALFSAVQWLIYRS
jgi:preprotein translocase SecE subunit